MISPMDLVNENDFICQACWNHANAVSLSGNRPEGSEQTPTGHRRVCIHCGRSLLRRVRCHQLRTGTVQERRIQEVIREWILPRSVKRMGVGGQLVPFFKCVCVYFVALGAGTGGAGPSPGAVAAKCAPVLCLLLVVLLHHSALPYHKAGYARRVAAGLALSALGDALLVWPQHFVAGMAAFAGAHVAYIAALGWARRAAVLGVALYAATGCFLALVSPPAGLRALVPAYALLLATMAWRGAARGGAAAPGALLFLMSDAILGYSLFGGPVPYQQVLVMSTYYLAQLGITLSALWAAEEARP